MKILDPRSHGLIDFALAAAFLAAPRVLGFDTRLAAIAYGVSALHLVLTLATRFPPGLARVIPFPLHGLIEFAEGVVFIALPWAAGFSGNENGRTLFVGAGLGVLVVFLITDYLGTDRSREP